jgi:Tfp pilus assembly protein PilX
MNSIVHPPRPEQGATLVVTLIMLVMMTLFAIAAVNLSGANVKVIGNMQARTAAESAALWAIEDTLSSINWFTTNSAIVRSVAAPNGLTAQVQSRSCKFAQPAQGDSALHQNLPEDTVWEFKVEVTDPVTNAKAGMWQGTKIRMLAGNCL